MNAKIYSQGLDVCIEGDLLGGVTKIICHDTTTEDLSDLYEKWCNTKFEPFHRYLEYFYDKEKFEIY